ncbi:MAG: hypothetical protein PHI88_01485 [Candidatus Pacebacteria bacterium]|nr:hypothetical protein [Candidatus Paceibacterota bacterium]
MGQRENIKKIKDGAKNNQGFDIVIIVSSNNNSKYWERRLRYTRKEILPKKTKIICIEEKWKDEDGAGQLLGTLNAIKFIKSKLNIEKELRKGKTVAMYHTAGKGKRMAPLSGTEKNNKPAIKLPKPIKVGNKNNLISLLEAVIYSTQIFAKSREGRLCVFWGDQIIIPSRISKIETKSPVEIFGVKQRIKLSKKIWEENWKMYGILIPQKENALQRDKLSWQEIIKIKRKGTLKEKNGKIGFLKSAGCFSINLEFLKSLLQEFSKDLENKNKKIDTDPGLWMPITIEKPKEGKNYWERINNFKKRFILNTGNKNIISAKDLGKNTIFWDYGNISCYYKNILKIIEKSKEGKVARLFFGVEKYFKNNSLFVNSKTKGITKNSVILNSEIKSANLQNSIVINSKIKKVKGKNMLLYYIQEKDEIKTLKDEIITDIKIKDGEIIRMKTKISRDSKEDWEVKLPENPLSYSEIEKIVSKINIK